MLNFADRAAFASIGAPRAVKEVASVLRPRETIPIVAATTTVQNPLDLTNHRERHRSLAPIDYRRNAPRAPSVPQPNLNRRKTMHTMSLGYWIVVIAVVIAVLYPYVRILRRTGYSAWWVVAMFIPIVNMIMLWVFAFAKWPGVTRVER
jgi:uncharacterized membrane protein YhaH (DUF805 family)